MAGDGRLLQAPERRGLFEIGLLGAAALAGGAAGVWIGGRVDSRFGPKLSFGARIRR